MLFYTCIDFDGEWKTKWLKAAPPPPSPAAPTDAPSAAGWRCWCHSWRSYWSYWSCWSCWCSWTETCSHPASRGGELQGTRRPAGGNHGNTQEEGEEEDSGDNGGDGDDEVLTCFLDRIGDLTGRMGDTDSLEDGDTGLKGVTYSNYGNHLHRSVFSDNVSMWLLMDNCLAPTWPVRASAPSRVWQVTGTAASRRSPWRPGRVGTWRWVWVGLVGGFYAESSYAESSRRLRRTSPSWRRPQSPLPASD